MIIVQIVLFTAALFFSCFGVYEIVKKLSLLMFRAEKKRLVTLLPLYQDDDEILLYSCLALSSEGPVGKIVALDCGLSPSARCLVDGFCRCHPEIEVKDTEQFLLEVLDGADPSRTG